MQSRRAAAAATHRLCENAMAERTDARDRVVCRRALVLVGINGDQTAITRSTIHATSRQIHRLAADRHVDVADAARAAATANRARIKRVGLIATRGDDACLIEIGRTTIAARTGLRAKTDGGCRSRRVGEIGNRDIHGNTGAATTAAD